MFEAPILDPMRLCRLGDAVEGNCLPGDLTLLQDELRDLAGEVHYRIAGGFSDGQKPLLTVCITGHVSLTCQRCLEKMRFDLDIQTHLVLVPDEAALPALDEEKEGWDVIVRPERLSVVALVQEEILLALPVAPMHADKGCGAAELMETDKAAHPFAVLRKLT